MSEEMVVVDAWMEAVEAALRSGVADGRSAPRAFAPPVLADADVTYVEHDTSIGRLVLAATSDALVACSFAPAEVVTQRLASVISPRVLRSGARLDEARRQLDAYLIGERKRFELPVDLALAGSLGKVVLPALGAVGYGATTTYGDLATAIGRPRAARAVGSALASNPLCVIVPCHRVVPAVGGVGGYAGGPAVKRALLALERSDGEHGG